MPAEQQYDLYTDQVTTWISRFGSAIVVAELTKASNIHYHCMLTCEGSEMAVRKRLNDSVRNHKIIGFLCTKLCTDEKGWLDYMTKEVKETKSTLGRRPIVLGRPGVSSQMKDYALADCYWEEEPVFPKVQIGIPEIKVNDWELICGTLSRWLKE